jgi:hypothetical protein
MTGQVTSTISGQPIPDATVEMSGFSSVSTDGEGRFTLTATSAPTGSFAVKVSAAGYRTRQTSIAYPRSGNPVIDLTSTGAPFREDFYNELARDTFERPEQRTQLWRWSTAPRVYLKTTDETGRPVPPEVVSLTVNSLMDGVRLFSAGAFSATVEQGLDARAQQPGWINVEFRQTIPQGDYCGIAASVGGNPNAIQLRLERCGCGSIKVPGSVVYHEVGHVLGFFHVGDRNSVMHPFDSGECRQASLSALEQTHVGVAYARPRGNLDPDRDPPSFTLFVPPATAGARGPIP